MSRRKPFWTVIVCCALAWQATTAWAKPKLNPFDALLQLADEGLKAEVGLLLGAVSFDANAGLGNAHFDDDVPDGGFLYGMRGGLLLGPNKTPRIGLDVELRFAHPDLRAPPASVATAWAWRVMGRWLMPPRWKRVQPFVAAGIGQEIQFAAKEHVDLTDFDAALVIGGGADIKILHRLHARVDLRWVLSEPRPETTSDSVTWGVSNTIELQVGLGWHVGGPPPDEDDDGVYDDGRDKCPGQPEDVDGFQDTDGCPDTDNDGDKILDAFDKCPDSPEDIDNFKDKDGCPEPDNDDDGVLDLMDKCPHEPEDIDGHQDADGCPETDNDGDGVADTVDRCPNDPEDKDGFADADGCPEVDNDGDGVIDRADKCPNIAEDFDGFQDVDGCPDVDNDGDGIVDSSDACPLEPENYDGVLDRDGCPDVTTPLIRDLLSGPVSGIVFIKDQVEPVASERGLQRILSALRSTATLRLQLRCPIGAAVKKQEIATRTAARCRSVAAWLAAHNIKPTRLKVTPETSPRGEAGVSMLELTRW